MIGTPASLPHIAFTPALLPEIALSATAMLIILVDAVLPKQAGRNLLCWVAAAGAVSALAGSLWQLRLPAGTAFFGKVEVSPFSIFFHVLISAIVLVTILTAAGSFVKSSEHAGAFLALILIGAAGMCLMTGAAGLLLIFIGLEISSVSTCILATSRKRTGSLTRAWIACLVPGSLAGAFFLVGIALAFAATGSTSIAGIMTRLGGSTPGHGYFAMTMMLIGLSFEISAAPFHLWTPNAYQGIPAPAAGLISTAPVAAGVAVLLRIALDAFPRLHPQWALLVWILAAISMTAGNLAALRQRNIKHMLASSSVAHAGYLLVAFTALSKDGIAAAIFYTAAYSVTNLGIFAVISHLEQERAGLISTADYCGLAFRSPMLGGALVLFLVSLTGIPFTAGFFGKFYVFAAAFGSRVIWLTILGLANSGVAAFYYMRLAAAVYSRPEDPGQWTDLGRPRPALGIALLLTASATLILGIYPGRTILFAQRGAEMLLRVREVPTQSSEPARRMPPAPFVPAVTVPLESGAPAQTLIAPEAGASPGKLPLPPLVQPTVKPAGEPAKPGGKAAAPGNPPLAPPDPSVKLRNR